MIEYDNKGQIKRIKDLLRSIESIQVNIMYSINTDIILGTASYDNLCSFVDTNMIAKQYD